MVSLVGYRALVGIVYGLYIYIYMLYIYIYVIVWLEFSFVGKALRDAATAFVIGLAPARTTTPPTVYGRTLSV